jgi:hypothetical protein
MGRVDQTSAKQRRPDDEQDAGLFARYMDAVHALVQAVRGRVRGGAPQQTAPALAFVGHWGRLKLLLGTPAAKTIRSIAFMCCFIAALARVAELLGYSSKVMRPLVQIVGLLALGPVCADPKALRAIWVILSNRSASGDPVLERTPARVRFEVRPLVEAAHFARAADLLCSASVVGGATAAAWLRALLVTCDGSTGLPAGCVLVEVFAAEAPPPAASPRAAASRWGSTRATPTAQPARGAQPNRLLGLLLARVVQGVDIHALGTHPLLPGDASIVLCEVPFLSMPGWFPTQEQHPSKWRPSSLAVDACMHVTRRLGCVAALMPAPCGGMPAPFSSLAFSLRGGHAITPALGGPPDSHLVCIPPALVGCGSLDIFSKTMLTASQRKALRSRKNRFARAGGVVMTIRPDALAADEHVMRLLAKGSGVSDERMAEKSAVLVTTVQQGSPIAFATVLVPPQTDAQSSGNQGVPVGVVTQAMTAMATAVASLDSTGQGDFKGQPLALTSGRRTMFALSARVQGQVAGAALVLLDASTGVMTVAHSALVQPLARTSGASEALSRGVLELALVHGAVAVDLGTHPSARRLGGTPMPRVPFLLFADDRLAACKAASSTLYTGLVRYAGQLKGVAAAAGSKTQAEDKAAPTELSNKRRKRLTRKALRAGLAAEAARRDATVQASVETDDVASFKDAATVVSSHGTGCTLTTLAGVDVTVEGEDAAQEEQLIDALT